MYLAMYWYIDSLDRYSPEVPPPPTVLSKFISKLRASHFRNGHYYSCYYYYYCSHTPLNATLTCPRSSSTPISFSKKRTHFFHSRLNCFHSPLDALL